MNDVIYPDQFAAKAACEEYVRELSALQARLGIREECEDSCCAVYIYAKYISFDGSIQDYCYF